MLNEQNNVFNVKLYQSRFPVKDELFVMIMWVEAFAISGRSVKIKAAFLFLLMRRKTQFKSFYIASIKRLFNKWSRYNKN